MQTIADSYIEEGINKGITLGKNEGITLGIEKIAKRMLKEKVDLKFISSVTSLSIDEVLKLKNKL